jgi:hypothetical protein
MSGAILFRFRWAAGHFALSAVLFGAVVIAFVSVWYPPPLASLQGLQTILLLIALVDLALGPLCTLLVASPNKSRGQILRDVAIIAAVQLVALAYGVHAVWVARPAYVVFNKDRFDVVSASEVENNYFGRRTDGEFAFPPIGRARWVHALPPSSLDERNRILLGAAAGGPDLRHYSALFHRWPQDTEAVRARLKPLSSLAALSDENADEVSAAVARSGVAQDQLAYLPLVGRSRIGVVVVKREDLTIVEVLGIAPDY